MEKSLIKKMLERNSKNDAYELHFRKDSSVFGYMLFSNGKRHYVSQNDLNINSYIGTRIARHKWTTHRFLDDAGFNVPESFQVFNKNYINISDYSFHEQAEKITAFVRRVGFPVFLKPAEGSQGKGVAEIFNQETLDREISSYLNRHRELIVEEKILGNEVRMVLYNGQLFLAYEKEPQKLKDGTESLNNLSCGARAIVCTDRLHSSYIKIAQESLNTLDIKYAAVDIIIDGDISQQGNAVTILEINTNPGYRYFLGQHPHHHDIIDALFGSIISDICLKYD